MAGYSSRPLHAKLGIAPGQVACTIGAPPGYRALLGPDAPDVPLPEGPRPGADFTHAFVSSRAELEALLAQLRHDIDRNGMIWISWPKRASGVPTDVTEDVVRELALPLGLVDVKVSAVDATWSALKLVIRKDLR